MQIHNQSFNGKSFQTITGQTHPQYSIDCFSETGEESSFRKKYWKINENDVVIDCGASYGNYSLTAALMGAAVYSFEPEKTIFNDLCKNIDLNKWNNKCFPFNIGLWSNNSNQNMKDYAPHWPSQTITSVYHMDTLDNIVKENNIKKIDYIKMDIEGAEEHAINGALETIKKFHPKLIIECHIFLDAELKNKIKKLISSCYDYEFEEVERDPCIMLIATPKTRKIIKKNMKIAILLGNLSVGARPLNFSNIFTNPRGLTGTDLSFCMISRELVKLGHDVSMFTVHTDSNNLITWEGAKLYKIEERFSINESFDVIISINDPNDLRNLNTKPLRICWQFLNDFNYCQSGYDEFVDMYLTPCQMHMEHVQKLSPSPDKFEILALGCSPEWYEEQKIPGRIIYCSSADRGLHWALQIFPEIKKAVPNATFKIFYHLEYGSLEDIDPKSTTDHPHIVELGNRIRYIRENLKKLSHLGVEHVGSVSVEEMKKQMNEAEILLYPVDPVAFSEGFSLSILSAHASGVIPVITDADCIGSIYKDSGSLMIEQPIKNKLKEYTELAIKVLTDKKFATEAKDKCKQFANQYLWPDIAKKLEQVIKDKNEINK